MKTNFKRIGKQSISIVLAVMMMLSTMLVGMVTSNAVEIPANTDFYLDISNATDKFANPSTIYMSVVGTGNENYESSEIDSSAITKGNYSPSRDTWYQMTQIDNSNIYKVTVTTSSNIGKVSFWSNDIRGYDDVYAVSCTLGKTYDGKNNLFTLTKNSVHHDTQQSYSFGGTWSTYGSTEPTEPTEPVANNVVYLKNAANWNESFFAYIWNDKGNLTDWASAPVMTYVSTDSDGNKIYKYENNNLSNYTDIIFRYGSQGSATAATCDSQTGDLTLNVGKMYNNSTNQWETYTAPTTTYIITTETPENGKVTTSATSLAAGKTFTVTASPNDGYVLDTVTVKDANGNVIEPNTDGTYTMPASNVTVSATFKVKTDVKYSVTYTAPTGEGVVDSSINPTDTALAEGTNVTVTVTVNDGYTASLAVDRATVTTSTSGNTYTFTFSMPAQNITVAPKVTKAGENTGTLIPNLYLIYSDSSSKPSDFTQYLNLYYNSDNQVYAYFDESNFDDSKEYCFMISNSKGESTSWEYAYENYNKSKTLSDSEKLECGQSDHWLPMAGQGQSVQAVFAKFKVRDAYVGTISSVKINLGYYDGKDIVESSTDSSKATTYEVIPTSGVEGMVQVFAKDGTIRATYQKYADMADTVLTAENTTDLTKYAKKDYYDTAYAKVGTKLKITTTIGEGYREKYFVKAFSINGYSYGIIDASQADTTDGVYTCEYTIPEDFKGSRIEITPIYYYIDDTDTVTFYVEGFDETVQAKWGNTVAVQAWYTNGVEKDEFNSLTKNALGGYPGQPLVYEGGKYSMQIPKYLNGNKANMVSGITLNNYFWDDIHKQSFSDTSDKSESNCQTYDYDDFYKLSETADVDNIIFDFRYRTTIDNAPKDNLTNSTYNPDELEPLKDYSGNIVDIFGNILSKDWTAEYDSEYLTVISDGYKNNENIGKYATEWSVYAPDGAYITTINCSSLIDKNKVDSTYKEAYEKLEPYANLPVKIAYEKSLYGGHDKGTRADGRWYFSKKAQKISANVKIEYRADDTSPFIEDAFVADSNVGEKTGAKAYFTNADYNGKTTCQGEVDGGNFSVHAQTDANANYYFLGWYLKTSDGYSFITNESDTDIPMTNNATYVARFINTPSGTLTLSHTLLDGSAYGKTFIKADIIDSTNNVKASIDETSGNLVIPSKYVTYTSTYIIRLTLRTVPCGNDTVEGFYEGYSSDKPVRYNKDFTGTGEQTYSVERAISSLFEEIKNTDGSISYKLKKSNIPFYSNITSNPLEYTITYTYNTRLDGEQSYVIKDKVSGIELEEMWAENVAAGLTKEQLSKAFIIRKAPFVSNFREVITWDMDKATINGYVATVSANTTTVDLNISALTVAGQWTQPAIVKYGELAKSSNGDYLYKTGTTEFPEKFNYSGTTEYEFSFWAIFDNIDEAKKYSDAVKAYMLDAPAADMSQRLTALTKLDGYKNLISKSYSKEYNYISYQNYYIVPVYAGRFAKSEINESQASIRLLEYTRNQWTNANGVKGDGSLNVDGSKTDYLYTDFALSFDKDQELIKNNANIKVGVTFEVVAKYKKDFDLKNYATDSDKNSIGNLVKAATANGKVGTYTMDGAERNVYKYEINNSNISVKNRIEYYLRFKNSETSQQNVMKVYSYIYDTVSGKIYLSDPVYMNMYDIGNLTYITSDLANINLGPDATV
ncbi:InlB B-repeat-containing protein [Ruminococcus sp.]|uniref:InlB B-repeat-containing protein n=1 Tax=Ruminococcus sp. TaxID=41978 RepID=UPI0039933A6C